MVIGYHPRSSTPRSIPLPQTMDPWASPWAEDEGAQGASAPPPVAPLSSTPPVTTTSDADVDPWATTGAVSGPTEVHPSNTSTTTAVTPPAQHDQDTSVPWPDVGSDSTADPWAQRRETGDTIPNDDRWQPSTTDTLSQDGVSSQWNPSSSAADVLSSTQRPTDDVVAVEEGVDPWAATPYTAAPTQSHNDTTSPFHSTRLRNLDQSLADPPKPADVEQSETIPSSTASATTQPPQPPTNADADSGPGWEMKKKQGAAALADRLGGWMRSAVTAKNADAGAAAEPQVASAADEDEDDEQQPMPDQPKPPVQSDLFNDPISEQPQQPQQQQQPGAMGRFLNRWRKPAADTGSSTQAANDSVIVDEDGLDWLGAQGNQSTSVQVIDPQHDFLAETATSAVTPAPAPAPPSRATRPRTSFPVSSTGRGVQQAPAPVSTSSRFASRPQQPANDDPFDFSAFEDATPSVMTSTSTATRAPTSYPRPLSKLATTPRPVVPPIRSTAVESDAFEVFNRASSSRVPAESTSRLPRPAQMPAPAFYSGRAQEDDFERSGYDYREEDESADDWGWGMEQPANKYDDEFASQDSITRRNAPPPPLPPPKQQQQQQTSTGSSLLNRAASLSSAPLSRAASSSSSSGGTSSKRGSLLPPPPPGRNRMLQLGSGAGLNRSSSVTAGGARSSSQNSSGASSPALAAQPLPQQHHQQQQPQRPTSSLSKGGGMTCDDLAFFEGL